MVRKDNREKNKFVSQIQKTKGEINPKKGDTAPARMHSYRLLISHKSDL